MTTSWATLDPWEKAAQWTQKAPHLAADVVAVAKTLAEHRMQMERDAAAQRALMETRLWYTQIASVAVNILSLVVLAVIAVKFGKDALAPALAVLGAGGGLKRGLARHKWCDPPDMAELAA